MPLKIPDRQTVVQTLGNYVRVAFGGLLDPSTSRRSAIGGQVVSLGNALHDWYVALKQYGENEPFPQTARDEFLTRGWWRDITGLTPNPAAPARGRVALTGQPGAVVLQDTAFAAGGQSYRLENSVTIATQVLAAQSLSHDGPTAIFETAGPHHLATGMTVTVSGASPADYNGAVTITVTAENEFTWELAADPGADSAAGAQAQADFAAGVVVADAAGQAGNIDAGGELQLLTELAGVDGVARAGFGGISGGAEAESDESYRERILKALAVDYGVFTGDEIGIVARQVPGVTRVFVKKATLFGANGVNEGQVKIAVMRDNDADPFPSAQEVQAVKDHLVKNYMPAHTAAEDVMVMAPKRQPVDFTFTALTPDTTGLRLAIRANLEQFFLEAVDFEQAIDQDDYECAIKRAIDPETGQRVRDFTLSAPAGDVVVAAESLPVLGSVTFV